MIDQDGHLLDDILRYWNIKAELEKEKRDTPGSLDSLFDNKDIPRMKMGG